MKRFFIVLVVIASSLISCKSTKSTTTNQKHPKPLELLTKANRWQLTSFNNLTLTEAGFNDRTPWVIINAAEGKISGFNGCNSFSGDAEISDKHIKTGMMLSTKAFCQGVPEAEFFDILEKATSYEIKMNN